MRPLLAFVLVVIAASAPSASAAPRTEAYVTCGSRGDYAVNAKPRDCFLGWPNLPLAGAVGLRHIAWTGWGTATAHGHAVTRTKTYDPWTHVRVVAEGRRFCGTTAAAKTYVYTRVKVDFGHGNAHTWRTPGCALLGGG